MENVTTLNVRPSDLLLDRVFNPARDEQIGGATPAQLAEACGIIPDFFCQACMVADPLTLDNIAAGDTRAAEYLMMKTGGSPVAGGSWPGLTTSGQNFPNFYNQFEGV